MKWRILESLNMNKYQLAILGESNSFADQIQETLNQRIEELGIPSGFIEYIDDSKFNNLYKSNLPTVALYFGDIKATSRPNEVLKKVIADAALIIPIVSDLKEFSKQMPDDLLGINGFELSSSDRIEQLVSCILEGFNLLRHSRRIFISYKRDDSSKAALQLYERLEKSGFDVFLDTHSIRPGEIFQDELWHRLADTDVVVMLNTPGFMKSHWTKQELANANTMSIGILQIIWPNHKLERNAELCEPFQLTAHNFSAGSILPNNNELTSATIDSIIELTESMRARSLASRQNNIIGEFKKVATNLGMTANLQHDKMITITSKVGDEYLIIPAIGVPQSPSFNKTFETMEQKKSTSLKGAVLLYDHRNIRDHWIKHLTWLSSHLPVKAIKITEAKTWLGAI